MDVTATTAEERRRRRIIAGMRPMPAQEKGGDGEVAGAGRTAAQAAPKRVPERRMQQTRGDLGRHAAVGAGAEGVAVALAEGVYYLLWVRHASGRDDKAQTARCPSAVVARR